MYYMFYDPTEFLNLGYILMEDNSSSRSTWCTTPNIAIDHYVKYAIYLTTFKENLSFHETEYILYAKAETLEELKTIVLIKGT